MHVRSSGLWRPTYSQLLKYVCKRSCQTRFFEVYLRVLVENHFFSLSLSFFSPSLSARRCSLTRRFTDHLVNGTPFSCTRGGNRLQQQPFRRDPNGLSSVRGRAPVLCVRGSHFLFFFGGGGFSALLSGVGGNETLRILGISLRNMFWEV